MILKKIYNEDTKTQRVWYDSSMIAYTEMVEDEYENKGNLYVTFKNSTTYVYKDVAFEDYMVFIGGGTDASQGKTLNKIIKNKYEYEKCNGRTVEDLFNELEFLNNSTQKDLNKVYFISGHRDIVDFDFEFKYIPYINMILSQVPDAEFVIGDCEGVDIMAQNYLIDVLNLNPERITVFHVGEKPSHVNTSIINLIGGFNTHEEKDEAMTQNSMHDIAFVRNNKEISGTAQNILRRYIL